jgi:hypothetical protein
VLVEFNVQNVTGKLIMVLVGLFGIICVGGIAFYATQTDFPMLAVPFIFGAVAGLGVNIYKVLSLRQMAANIAKKDNPVAAAAYQKGSYFLRMIVTLAVLLIVAIFFHNLTDADGRLFYITIAGENIPLFINVMGTAITLLSWPVAMYSLHFFIRDALVDDIMTASTTKDSTATDAIAEIEKISGKEGDSE